MICAIVLAAGKSQRMGTQKLLLPFRGSTLIERAVDAFIGIADDTIVVIPKGDLIIRQALGSRPVIYAENPLLEGDMLSSVRCGIRALPTQAQTILVSPADQPSLEDALVREMAAAFNRLQATLLVPVHAGRRGHPLIFDARFCQEILTSFEDTGLRGLLSKHSSELIEWITSSPAVIEDLDTPADYERSHFGDLKNLGPLPGRPDLPHSS